MPSSSPTMACIVSASTRRPLSLAAAARGVVCSSSSSRAIPMLRRSSARAARVCVVLLVTNRIRWPSSRRRPTASAPPAIGSRETWKTPSTSSRIAAMDGESIRVTRSVVLPLGDVRFRTSRSSGPGGQHAQKSETRVEAVFDVESSEALTAVQKRHVVVDVRDAEFIDSSTLGVLLGASRDAEHAGLGFTIALTNRNYTQVNHLLDLTGLGSAFAIYETLDNALAAARRGENGGSVRS